MSMMINRLSERVTIQQRSIISDGLGGQEISWSELASVYAEVKAISNYTTERSLSDAVHATAGYRVTIRARGDVDASMRVIWKTRVLRISSLHAIDDVLELLTFEESV